MATLTYKTFFINHRNVFFTDWVHFLSFLPCSLSLQHSLVSQFELLIRSWSFFGGSSCQNCSGSGMTEVKRLTNWTLASFVSDKWYIKNIRISFVYHHRLVHRFRIEVEWIVNCRSPLMAFFVFTRSCRWKSCFSVDQSLGLFSIHTYSIIYVAAWSYLDRIITIWFGPRRKFINLI